MEQTMINTAFCRGLSQVNLSKLRPSLDVALGLICETLARLAVKALLSFLKGRRDRMR